MKYNIFLVTILLCFFIFVICGKECGIQIGGKKNCCNGYRNVGGICIECAEGFYGEECQRPCPSGQYGVACKGKCNCKTDQICDAKEGCIYNNAESTLVMTETTSTEEQTTEPPEDNKELYWYQLFGIALGVVIIVMIILTVHTHRKWKSSDPESESRHDQQTGEARSQAVQLNKNTEESVYDEICEFDTDCSHTHTFSSASISFSRSRGKEVNQVRQNKPIILHLEAITR